MRPRIYAPYQPRFDWNLWFASLGNWRQYPLVLQVEQRLLDGQPDVLPSLPGTLSGAAPRADSRITCGNTGSQAGRKSASRGYGGGGSRLACMRPRWSAMRTARWKSWLGRTRPIRIHKTCIFRCLGAARRRPLRSTGDLPSHFILPPESPRTLVPITHEPPFHPFRTTEP